MNTMGDPVRLETRQLRYFVAVAEELHFGRAAKRLHMSQPPLSQQILQIEAMLGVQLFERTRRSVKLTHAGDVFLGQARTVLSRLDDAVDTVRAASRGEGGLLRLGCTSAGAYTIMPTLLRCFRERFPRTEVVLHELLSGEQTRDVLEARLDIGLVRLPREQPGLDTEKLLEERLVVAIPADHVLAAQPVVEVGDLHGVPFIGFSREGGHYFHDMIESMLGANHVSPTVVQRAKQAHIVAALVSAGLGLAVVPDSAARVLADRVVYRPLRADPLPRPALHVCWRHDGKTPLVHNFVALACALSVNGWDTSRTKV